MARKTNNATSKLVLVGALVPQSFARELKKFAKQEGRTVSQTIKRALENDQEFKAYRSA